MCRHLFINQIVKILISYEDESSVKLVLCRENLQINFSKEMASKLCQTLTPRATQLE